MSANNFDDFVANLQKEIIDKEKEEFNEYIVELFHNPKNWGKPLEKDISVSQTYTGLCGDTMHYYLKIEDDIITKANFVTDGCGASVATACQTTMLIEGKSLKYVENLTPEEIDKALKGLPDDHKHCAELSVRTLRRAISKYKDEKS
ncbi:MAG: iron-sulfur cluster assembly scaffold protein [Candidatus Lokiarchaeota archaeon]|nr:iron-sulfur cluster assembly scaffold protein [Candidatus Lokiarchaeota archaeon]